jgi:electron transfer flavoprotein alpha subunit
MTSTAVVVCTWGEGREGLHDEAEELLTLGRRLSSALGSDLNWLVLGSMPERSLEVAGLHGVASVDRIDDAKLEGFQPDATVEALAQYCNQHLPRALLVGQSFDSRLVAPRLAGRLGSAVVMNGVDLESDAEDRLCITASAYGGDTRVIYRLGSGESCIVAVMPNSLLPEPAEGGGSAPVEREIEVDLGGVEERIRVVEQARAEGPRLEEAEIIVSGGRGLGTPENYKLVEELAEALGGMAGASRPLVDDGWVDSSQQVGLTGRITRPALYLAAGISGASQHMAGCGAAKTIAAINTDPDAAIFRYARYGIVGDCAQILPELIRAVKGDAQ